MLQISMRAARVNAGHSQAYISHELGVSRNTIVSWELGRTFPKAAQLKRFSELCNVPIDNIFIPIESTKSEL